MTEDRMALQELIGKSADADFLREMVGFAGSCPTPWCLKREAGAPERSP